jgi:hypothetical protein
MKKALYLTIIAGIVVSSCAPTSRFEWGDYEAGLYSYYTNPSHRGRYIEALEMAIERGESTNRVAPGLHAELGHMFWEAGDIDIARAHFRAEMRLFPESRHFLERFIAVPPENESIANEPQPVVADDEVTS